MAVREGLTITACDRYRPFGARRLRLLVQNADRILSNCEGSHPPLFWQQKTRRGAGFFVDGGEGERRKQECIVHIGLQAQLITLYFNRLFYP